MDSIVLFWAQVILLTCGDAGAIHKRRLTAGKQTGFGAWVTGFYNCQVQCMLGEREVTVCLPAVSWDGGAEQVN